MEHARAWNLLRSAPRNNLLGRMRAEQGRGKRLAETWVQGSGQVLPSASALGVLRGDLHHIGCCYLVVPIGQGPYPQREGRRCEKAAPREPGAGHIPARWGEGGMPAAPANKYLPARLLGRMKSGF